MVALPDPNVAWALLVGTRRGLFFLSPVLALSALGVWLMASHRRRRVEALSCVTMFGVYWLFNASFNGWHGGDVFAPRYLLPAVPFLAVLLTPVYARFSWIAVPPALFSAAIMLLAAIVTPLPPEDRANPVWDFLVPLAFQLPHDSRTDFHPFKGPVSASPYGLLPAARPADAEWNSFNLGELLWPNEWLSVVPLFVCLAAGVTVVFQLSRREEARIDRHGDFIGATARRW